MAINTVDALINGLCNSRQKIPFAKITNLTNQSVGGNTSLFRNAGYPASGSTFTPGVLPFDNTSIGAIPFNSAAPGKNTHIAKVAITATGALGYELHDRLVQGPGLLGNTTAVQNVNVNLANIVDFNFEQRIVRSDYSAVQWWLEWATSTGSTATSALVSYTDALNVARTVTITLAASMALGRMLPIIPTTGAPIRSIESVKLNASTGTAGSFGVVATVQRTELTVLVSSQYTIQDWANLGLPIIYDKSCLFFIALANTTTVQPPSGAITFIQG